MNFDVIHGLLENVEITGDFFELQPIDGLEKKLNGVKFVKSEIQKALNDADKYIQNANGKDIADKML